MRRRELWNLYSGVYDFDCLFYSVEKITRNLRCKVSIRIYSQIADTINGFR